MDLQPARIETAWSCPVHAVVMKDEAGQCELDHRELVPVTINHFWVCPGSGKVDAEPGRCADGQLRQERKVVRAHGDHNPRHGGQFFMAGDRWHHLEGTYPAARLFRLYFYDNFTGALISAGISGRVFTREDASARTRSRPVGSIEGRHNARSSNRGRVHSHEESPPKSSSGRRRPRSGSTSRFQRSLTTGCRTAGDVESAVTSPRPIAIDSATRRVRVVRPHQPGADRAAAAGAIVANRDSKRVAVAGHHLRRAHGAGHSGPRNPDPHRSGQFRHRLRARRCSRRISRWRLPITSTTARASGETR